MKIKNILVPSIHNGYRPHAIRSSGLVVFGIYMLIFQSIYNLQTTGQFKVLGYATNVNISALLSSTNNERAGSGLSGLSLNSKLNQAAQSKANHMIANNYWSHYAPDGTSPWYFIESAGYSYERAGENLAYGFSSSGGVVQGWMDSPTHRANILDSGFSEVGFGIANGENFQGSENTVVVAMYGQPPAPAPVVKTEPKITQQTETESTEPNSEPVKTQEAEPQAPTKPTETIAPQSNSEPASSSEANETDQKDLGNNQEEIEQTTPNELASSQRLLASIGSDGQLSVSGSINNVDDAAGQINNLQALINGQAHWSLYMMIGGMSVMSIIYLIRHLRAISQIIVHGEHYVVGHPTLEAGIIYLAIWLMLFASYGAVL